MKLTLPIDPDGSICAPTDVPIVTTRPSKHQARTPHSLIAGARTDSNQTDTRSEFLLVCDAYSTTLCDGLWRFTLEKADGTPVFDAEDTEAGDLNRLTLLAAVRGLEAIEGPASVTLLSNNRYLIRSLSDSLPRWRQNDFVWEHFGRRIDVQHADLWRRVDRALAIHRVEACLVSSRLVSAGPTQLNKQSDTGVVQRRIDSPHADSQGSAVPPPRGSRAKKPTFTQASLPSDSLRRWLMGSASKVDAPRQHRFTSDDLQEKDDPTGLSFRHSSNRDPNPADIAEQDDDSILAPSPALADR